MKKSRILAVGMIGATMLSSMPMTTFAGTTSGGSTGSGSVEGYVDTSVIKVEFPTQSLNYTLDPQGLLYQVGGNKLGLDKTGSKQELGYTVTFMKDAKAITETNATGSVFFTKTTYKDKTNEDGKRIDAKGNVIADDDTTTQAAQVISNIEYTDQIDLPVINKSSCNIKITPTITATEGTNIKLSQKADFSDVEKKQVQDPSSSNKADTIDVKVPAVYFGLMLSDGKTTLVPAKDENGIILPTKAATPENAQGIPGCYVYSYNKNYTYTLDESKIDMNKGTVGKNKPAVLTYKLKAACNADGYWTSGGKAVTDKPTVKITWDIVDEATYKLQQEREANSGTSGTP